jgi:hypothetical protein
MPPEWLEVLGRLVFIEVLHAAAPVAPQDRRDLGVAAARHVHQVVMESCEAVGRVDDERPDAGLRERCGEARPDLAYAVDRGDRGPDDRVLAA